MAVAAPTAVGFILAITLSWTWALSGVVAALLIYVLSGLMGWAKLQTIGPFLYCGLLFGLTLNIVVQLDKSGHRYSALLLVLVLATGLILLLGASLCFGIFAPPRDGSPYNPRSDSEIYDTVYDLQDVNLYGTSRDGSLHWQFQVQGECDGPAIGTLRFSNGFAFSGITPSFALSDDNRYLALVAPTRISWCNHIVDFQSLTHHDLGSRYGLWKIESVDHNRLVGRKPPFDGSPSRKILLSTAVAHAQSSRLAPFTAL